MLDDKKAVKVDILKISWHTKPYQSIQLISLLSTYYVVY